MIQSSVIYWHCSEVYAKLYVRLYQTSCAYRPTAQS